jgi:hypothetical protein
MNVGDVFTYEGPVWDFDAEMGELINRPAECRIVQVTKDWYVVKLERYPRESYEYLIARVMLDAPTEHFQRGYEAALEDLKAGKIPMYIAGLLDEHEFMGQMPERHNTTVAGPFFELEDAVARARTMSSDPDEAVVVPVKP